MSPQCSQVQASISVCAVASAAKCRLPPPSSADLILEVRLTSSSFAWCCGLGAPKPRLPTTFGLDVVLPTQCSQCKDLPSSGAAPRSATMFRRPLHSGGVPSRSTKFKISSFSAHVLFGAVQSVSAFFFLQVVVLASQGRFASALNRYLYSQCSKVQALPFKGRGAWCANVRCRHPLGWCCARAMQYC